MGAEAEDAMAVGIAEKVHLLRIGSPPAPGSSSEKFRDILLHGAHLRPCRKALEDHNLDFVLPQGALMVVTPQQYHDVRCALKGQELHPFHLIVAEQFEYLIEEILTDKFPSFKNRPRVKSGAAGRQELQMAGGQGLELEEAVGCGTGAPMAPEEAE